MSEPVITLAMFGTDGAELGRGTMPASEIETGDLYARFKMTVDFQRAGKAASFKLSGAREDVWVKGTVACPFDHNWLAAGMHIDNSRVAAGQAADIDFRMQVSRA